MISTSNQQKFIDIFRNNLKKGSRTISISTLLSDRNKKRIDYAPYYQRNYVWENDKQSFFIESILLGTEIPPLIFFKSGMRVEVIDGRQRFETLKRFRENDFALSLKGLIELQGLAKLNYSKLSPEIQRLFDNTKIRVFEFEIVGIPDVDPIIEDKIKKEIFRRYNSGITPLTNSEIDNAKYDQDIFSDFFKKKLDEDSAFYNIMYRHFFANSTRDKKVLIGEMGSLLRKMLVLSQLPITRYADSGKSIYLDLLYDNYIEELNENGGNIQNEIDDLLSLITSISCKIDNESGNVNECLIWGIRILQSEGVKFSIEQYADTIRRHYNQNIHIYQTNNDHYYGNVIERFTDTANFLKSLTGFDFKLYLRSPEFKKRISEIKQSESDAEETTEKLSRLRLHKPDPETKPVYQLLEDIESNNYLIRPTYQRQEKINVKKASSIIESILLGIKLPPIFIFSRTDGTREVIDGQQRLLSIVGFLGKTYKNEEGQIVTAKNHNFRLKDLRILHQYNGKKYSDIISEIEDTILDFDIDEIEISEDLNENFEATDLFIRLNSKPYPIKQNSFEMWNSITDMDIIERIKNITSKNQNWFYMTAPKIDDYGKRRDRMQNEELITVLSYICYNQMINDDYKKILDFYARMQKFICRLKTKNQLTDLLEKLEFKPTDKELFIKSIQKTEDIVNIIGEVLLDGNKTKDAMNEILNVKNLRIFSRRSQEFYILWLLLYELDSEKAKLHKQDILSDITDMFVLLENVDNKNIDNQYVDSFLRKLNDVRDKYSKY